MSKDAIETLGTLPVPPEAGRDAIHLAVIPAVAGERLLAGQDVHLNPDGTAVKDKDKAVGIVDPFIKRSVQAGERFWLFLYPRTITSLRHVWSHPAFEDEKPADSPDPEPVFTEEDKERARHVAEKLTHSGERWLRDFCANNDCPSYESIMDAIKNGGRSVETDEAGDTYGVTIKEDYILVSGSDAHGTIPPEFWVHVEAVTGKKQPSYPTYFSCSC